MREWRHGKASLTLVKLRHLLKGDARAKPERCLFPELELVSLDSHTPKYGSVAFVDICIRTADHSRLSQCHFFPGTDSKTI
jgi:hypothetical protein